MELDFQKHNYVYISSCSISAMIDSVGGPRQMNNLLATLNLPLVNDKNLKVSNM